VFQKCWLRSVNTKTYPIKVIELYNNDNKKSVVSQQKKIAFSLGEKKSADCGLLWLYLLPEDNGAISTKSASRIFIFEQAVLQA
jgi:hypothetical protein